MSETGVDATTDGDWQSHYGNDAYNVLGFASPTPGSGTPTPTPGYVTLVPSNYFYSGWTVDNADVRELLKPGSTDRVANVWASGGSFDLYLQFTDSNVHNVALYLLDWENCAGGRQQTVTFYDATTGQPLSSPAPVTIDHYHDHGKYLTWNVRGYVVIRMTTVVCNAVVSGIFFDPARPTLTPASTLTPTPTLTPTLVPGVCEVLVAHHTVDFYQSAEAAAISIADSQHGYIGAFGQNLTLEVYKRSNLYANLVKVATAAAPAQYYWIDSGGGAITPTNGTNCSGLTFEQSTVSNPQTTPTYTNYPLHPVSVPIPSALELYQFAIVNGNNYSNATAQRHPGTDFFPGPVSAGSGEGVRVASIANGNIVGFYDPSKTPNLQVGLSNWIALASPTDKPDRAYVVIRYGNTIVLYAHLQPGLRIGNPDDPVVAGQWIGSIGQNPVEGPHLHLEVRTYGQNTFDVDTATTPLTFINGWYYFIPTIQNNIDQNIINRNNDDGQAVAGWNGLYSGGTQLTQCFTTSVNPPSGAPSGALPGISLHGYENSTGNNYAAFEWVDNQGNRQVFQTTASGTWQSACVP